MSKKHMSKVDLQSSQVETSVVYVKSANAKRVKVELESKGYLDKRFKMVKVADGTYLIALPVTDDCLAHLRHSLDASDNDDLADHSFASLIVKVGKEVVSLSSSSIGKIKQKR